MFQHLQERFGLEKRVLAGLLSADEVKVHDSLTAYNFVGQEHCCMLAWLLALPLLHYCIFAWLLALPLLHYGIFATKVIQPLYHLSPS